MGGGCVAGVLQRKQRSPLAPLLPSHYTEPKPTPCSTAKAQMIAPQKATKEGEREGQRGGNNIRENMHNAKNNHCVMRKQNWAASGARLGIFRKEGGRNLPWQCQTFWLKKKNLKSPKLEQTVVRVNSSTEHDFKGWFFLFILDTSISKK